MVNVMLDGTNAGRSLVGTRRQRCPYRWSLPPTFGGAFSLYGRVSYEPPPISTAVLDERSNARELSLGPAYPNPFNGQVLLPLTLSQERDVDLSIYNSMGQLEPACYIVAFCREAFTASTGMDEMGGTAGGCQRLLLSAPKAASRRSHILCVGLTPLK